VLGNWSLTGPVLVALEPRVNILSADAPDAPYLIAGNLAAA